MGKEVERKKKNVLLTCLSLAVWTKPKAFYEYEDKNQIWPMDGYNTNEAPIKRVIEVLNREGHGERLDRIVMICSKEAKEAIRRVDCAADFEHIHDSIFVETDSPKSLSKLTHVEYYSELIKNFAESVDESYKEHTIQFEDVEIKDFLDEQGIARAVTRSASLVLGEEDEDINLYVEYNGGPRIVTALELILCNLMKMRKKVNLREISYMDFDNKKTVTGTDGKPHQGCKISNMNKISDCMDLVSGINEYVNYGRTKTLKGYFNDHVSERTQNVLDELERFANDMQMCLTDYIMAEREKLKRDLEDLQEEYHLKQLQETEKKRRQESDQEYEQNQEDEQDLQSVDVYDLMFSFVADDILEGCRPLLDGEIPQMVKWCVDKGFIWQAMLLYEREMPEYFREKGILEPTEDGRINYLNWLYEQLQEAGEKDSTKKNALNEKKYTSYYWLNSYLFDGHENKHLSGSAEASEKKERIMNELNGEEKRVRSKLDDKTLAEILTAYFEIQSQCRTPECRIMELGDRGELWGYDKMSKKLIDAVDVVERFV